MDTILEHNDLGLLERGDLPSVPYRLTLLQRVFVKPWLKLKCFVIEVCTCGTESLDVPTWEFNTIARRKVVAMLDDDVEFSDLVVAYNHATSPVVDEPIGWSVSPEHPDQIGLSLPQESIVFGDVPCTIVHELPGPTFLVGTVKCKVVRPKIGVISGDTNIVPHGPRHGDSSAVDRLLGTSDPHERVRVHNRRRRRRVVTFLVVALINKVRCKYYQLDDTSANRRLVGSYLLKMMREHNFRTSDIHLHVHFAVDLYFEAGRVGIKPTVYARQ